jgi:hypothetical protein
MDVMQRPTNGKMFSWKIVSQETVRTCNNWLFFLPFHKFKDVTESADMDVSLTIIDTNGAVHWSNAHEASWGEVSNNRSL